MNPETAFRLKVITRLSDINTVLWTSIHAKRACFWSCNTNVTLVASWRHCGI